MSLPLNCLAGAPAPEPVQRGWTAYQELPELAQAAIWNLVAEGVAHPTAPGFLAEFEAFRDQYELEEESLRGVLQACGVLLGQAAALDLNAEQFQADLVNLSSQNLSGFEPILSRFDELKKHLREPAVFGSLADHGKVLTGLDWRIDRVASSNRAAQLNTDVIYLTLQYREGEETGRVTLQVSSQGIADLKAFLDRFGGI